MEVVPDLSWPEIVAGVRERNLDLVLTMSHRPEREAFVNFTEIYLPTPLVIMRRTGVDRIETEADLDRRTVAIVEGYSASTRVKEEHPGVKPLIVKNRPGRSFCRRHRQSRRLCRRVGHKPLPGYSKWHNQPGGSFALRGRHQRPEIWGAQGLAPTGDHPRQGSRSVRRRSFDVGRLARGRRRDGILARVWTSGPLDSGMEIPDRKAGTEEIRVSYAVDGHCAPRSKCVGRPAPASAVLVPT